MDKVIEKLVRWIVFSVALGIVPLVFSAFRLSTLAESGSIGHSLSIVISHGELLIVATLLCGGASGELFGGSNQTYGAIRTAAGGSAVVLLLFSALYYADVTVAQLFNKPIDVALVQITSIRVFVMSLLVSSVCVGLGAAQ